MKTLILLSDSTGDLGERFLQALMTQFPKGAFGLRVFSFIDQHDGLDKTLQHVKTLNPILFHTTIHQSLKDRIERFALQQNFPFYDLTGNVVAFLEKASGLDARPNAEALHELNRDYDKRINALDFAVEHDDGLREKTLQDADIVLVGVSRTSKTPTSIYLAHKGYRVANVPIVPDMPAPDLAQEDLEGRVVGLTIQPERLAAIRKLRAEHDGIPGTEYTSLEAICRELDIANRLFLRLHCPVIDVTNHAVEETGALVLKALHQR